MTVSTQVVRFQKSTGANGTTQDVNFTFNPTCIIVTSCGEETDNTLLDQQQLSIGFSDGTTQAVVSTGSQDNAAAGNAARIHRNDAVFCRLSETAPTTTIVSRGSVTLGTNKVTFTWDVNDAVATWITVWAFGGTHIRAKVISSDIGRTTAGTTDYIGLGFTPKGDNKTAVFSITGVIQSYNTITNHSNLSLGVATRTGYNSGKSFCHGISSENTSDPSDTWRFQTNDRDYFTGDGLGATFAYGYLNAWISDGFQVQYDGPPTATTFKNSFLVIDGGTWDVGTLTTPSAITANVDYAVSVGSKPIRGMMLVSEGTGIAGWNGFAVSTLGFTDGTNQAVDSSIDRDNQATTDSFRITAGNAVYAAYNSLGALTDRGNFDSFGTNSFRLDYTVKSTNLHAICWIVVADEVTPVTKTTTLLYDIEIEVPTILTKAISVLSNAGTGTQNITFTPNGTDPAWTPKLAIVTWSRSNTSLDTFQEHMSNGFGFTDGTNSRCVATSSEDNQTASDTGKIQRNNALICTLNPTGTMETVDSVATFVSWLSNGMQITWSDAPAAQFYFNVLFVGGTDITNVNVGTLASGTGTSPISVSSLAYQPDCGLFLSGGTATENTGVVGGFMSVGAAKSNSEQWVQSIYAQDASNNMVTKQYYSHGKVVVSHTTAVDGYATFTSFNSNGFTLTPTDAFPASFPIYYLVIKGGSFVVGNATEPASISGQTITTGKKTSAVMIFGLDAGTADAVQTGCMQSIGMGGSGTDEGVQVFEDTDVVGTSIVVSRHDTNQIYLNITSNLTATSSTLDDEADLSGISDTGFTMNWTNVGQARPYRYITFGKAVAMTTITKVLNLLYDLIGQATKQLTTRFDIMSQPVKVSTLRYDVRNELATPKQLTIRYDVRQETPVKQLTTRFDVIGQVTKILTGRYDIRQEVTDINTLKFDVRAEVTDTNTLRFDVRKEITPKQVTLRYDIITQIIKILTSRYDVRAEMATPKQVTLRHDIRAETTKANTLRFDVRQEVTKLLTAKFDIIAQISKQLTILFDIDVAGLTTVLKTLNLIYNVRAEIPSPKTVTLKYDVRKEVEKTNTFKFDVRMPVTKQVTILHNILKEVSKSTTVRYDVIAQVTKAVSLLFKITTSLEKISQLKFSVDAQVTKTNTLLFNVNNTITKTNTILYNILKDVTKQTTLRYDVIAQTTKILNLLYNIDSSLTNVIKTLSLKFNVDAQMTKANTLKFNVNVPIEKVNTLRYDIRNEITKISTIRFSIISQITKTLTTLYNVLDEVEKANTLKFNIDSQVTKSTSIKYNILNEVTKQNTIRFDILKDIVKTTTFLFNVISQTTKSVSIKYNVNNIVQKTNTLLYTINTLVENDVTLRYDVRKEIEKDVDIRYDIISQVTKTTNIQYNVLKEVTKIQTMIYDILKEVSKDVTLRYDMASQVQKLVTLKHSILKSIDKSATLIYNILPESITEHATMHEQLLDYINLQYSISNPLKTGISWHEWYNGISDITVESSFISLVPIDSRSTIIYKEKSYQCAIHIWYRDYSDDPEGQNTPTELGNVIREISLILNRSRYNMYNEFQKNVYEMLIRDERFIPDEYSKGSDGKILHYRYIVEMRYQQIIN